MLGLTQIFGKDKVVGVDIGSRFMKAVQAEAGRTPGSWRIVKAAVAPTPPDAVRDGIVMDQAGVAAALREMLTGAGIDATCVRWPRWGEPRRFGVMTIPRSRCRGSARH